MRVRLGATFAGALVIVAATATPAFAHSVLLSTDPGAGAVLDRAPRSVTLRFNEPVGIQLGGIRAYDSRGNRVEAGAPTHPGGVGSRVGVALPELPDGDYVVTWRVISADTHPVRGAFTFQVGNAASPSSVNGLATRLLGAQGGDTTVGVLFGVARFAVFASLALLLGGAALLAVCWAGGRSDARARRLVWAGWVACLAGTFVAFALQGPYGAGTGLADMFRPALWVDVFHTRFGHTTTVRVVALVVAFPLLRLLLPRAAKAAIRLPTWWPAAATATGVALTLSPGLSGHASTADLWPLALASDTIHVAAMGVWLGGLALLVGALLPRGDPDEAWSVLTRFSGIALGCVIALIVTGSYQSWREVGSLHNVLDTDYGRILALKVVGFVALVIAAAFGRDTVNSRYRARPTPAPVLVAAGVGVSAGGGGGPARVDAPATAWDDEWDDLDDDIAMRRLRRSVGIEVVVAIVVLALTALLVNAAPARAVTTGPVITTIKTPTMWFDIIVAPAKAGPNDIHVTAVTPTGGITDVISQDVELTQPSHDIAPLHVPMRKLGPGHSIAPGFRIPFPGTWRLTVKALVTDVDEPTGSTTFTIR